MRTANFLRVLTLTAVSTALLTFAACPKPPTENDEKDDKAATETPDKPVPPKATGPVARVNGEDVPRAAFDTQMDRTRARFKRAGRDITDALSDRLKQNMIRKLVDDTLIAQKAKKEGVTINDEDLQKRFNDHKAKFGSDKAFTAFLERTEQSEDAVKQELAKNLLKQRLFEKLAGGKTPTAEDAQKYYEENKDRYKQREQVRASHILFKIGKKDPEAKKKEQWAKAEKALKEAKAGGDFAELAKKYSEGPTAKRGGDLGKFSRGRMVKAFENVAFEAKPNQIVGPVETQFGYHVIKVFEKIPERQRKYDEVKDSILTSLGARHRASITRETLEQLKKDAKIEVLEPGVDLNKPTFRPPTPGGKNVLNPATRQQIQNGKGGGMGAGARPKTAPQPH